ncbi:hypothetical protein SCLAR_v1c04900 [Spiroplasma clarkii]|uniref:Uncharacterized protein n=1 Tax=Spiroplasma clarkii TaxID=2139 RepID=A0A2K8KK48_9MOLU|nr:hypothetical protein SCLAR_v1c04900 [Spiroplasma clarkii]
MIKKGNYQKLIDKIYKIECKKLNKAKLLVDFKRAYPSHA